MEWYKKVINECCIPGCGGYSENIHHICPLGQDGIDEIRNYFPCCERHHYLKKLHSDWNDTAMDLLTWKYMKELDRFGFTSNDYSDNEFMAKVNAVRTKKVLLEIIDVKENNFLKKLKK